MTLGTAAEARMRLILWCKACGHRVEPDPAEMVERYGADMAVPQWRERLVCSACGSRDLDMVVTATERR
jgi:DNA-directed RNA polymerase subunit RPC12/RpoP